MPASDVYRLRVYPLIALVYLMRASSMHLVYQANYANHDVYASPF